MRYNNHYGKANKIVDEYRNKKYIENIFGSEFIDYILHIINQTDSLLNMNYYSGEPEEFWGNIYELGKKSFINDSGLFQGKLMDFTHNNYFFWEQIENYYDLNTNSYLLNEDLLYLLYMLIDIVLPIKDVLRFASVGRQDDTEKPIIHYTKFAFGGDMIIPKDDKDDKDYNEDEQCRFPVFDAAIMDDPREGVAFCDLIFSAYPNLEQFYTENCSFFNSIKEKEKMKPTYVFLKSFMCKEPKDSDAIKYMWKKYGDKGKGVRIEFGLDTFLNKPLSKLKDSEHKTDDYSLYNIMYLKRIKAPNDGAMDYDIESFKTTMLISMFDEDKLITRPNLIESIQFLCITLEEIKKIYPSLDEKEKVIFDKVLSHYIAQVAFLFKDKESERGEVWEIQEEVRLLLYRSEKDESIKEKDKKNQHIYLPNKVQIKDIVLGERIVAQIQECEHLKNQSKK